MPRAEDITGKRFGRLVAIKKVGTLRRHPLWECQCDCGNKTTAIVSTLKSGKKRSCGCLHLEILRTNAITHGHNKERLYGVWHSKIDRVENAHKKSYRYYGGRGIKVCKEWREDYEAFRAWALANGYDENAPKGDCTLDRIDCNGDYEPGNCRWVSMKIQYQNRRPRSVYKHYT